MAKKSDPMLLSTHMRIIYKYYTQINLLIFSNKSTYTKPIYKQAIAKNKNKK